MMKQPDQQFYDACFQICLNSGYDTYPYKPLDDVPYPFVEVSEAILIPRATKTAILGNVSLTLHIWGEGAKRKQISDAANSLLMEIKEIKSTNSLRWLVLLDQCNIQLIQDTSTGTILWHGILDVTAKFY